jgi:uncharacterized membrane protein YdjX (TVP38/TMEM64 family)
MEEACAEDKPKKEAKKSGKVLMSAAIGVVVLLVGCYFIFPGFQAGVNEAFDVITSKDDERIQNWVQQFGVLGPVVLILAMMLQMFMFVVPNILLFMIAIICYGPVWGGLICLAGVFASSSLGYFIGHKLGPRAIDRFVSQKAQDKICIFIERYGVKAIAITRLSSFSNDALSFVAGILEMSYRKYILATLGGITPLITLLAIYGNNGKIEKALIWIAAISLISLGVYIYLDRHKRRDAYARYAGSVK